MTGNSYACAVKICPKLAYGVVKSSQFKSVYKKSWSLNTIVTAVFRPEAELTNAISAKMYSDRRVIPLLQEIGVADANGGVRFLTVSS